MSGERIAASVTLVVMTRDRRDDLLATLPRLLALPGPPPVIVLDNGSADGTVGTVRDRFPGVTVVPLGANGGVAARNLGVEMATTPYVAFADDDSWWSPDGLDRAVEVLDRHSRVGAVTGHVVVEPAGVDDPIDALLRTSPVPGDPAVPGVPVLGFLACAAAVRREAFLAVGGFEERLHFGSEEQLLAVDLAAAGWEVRYLADAVVHHQPSTHRVSEWRRRRDLRNALWTLWLRRPLTRAVRRTSVALGATDVATAAAALAQALTGLPWVVRARRRLPADVEASLRLLDGGA